MSSMKMSKRVSVEKVHSGTTAICNLWPFASCVDLLAQGWQGLIVCERTSLLQEQGATVVASQPIIDRRFEKAPGIFDPAARNGALSRLPNDRVLREAQIPCDFLQCQDFSLLDDLVHAKTLLMFKHSTTQQQKLAAECWYSTHHFPRKNRRTPRLIRNASIANAIGIPITALGSVPRNTLRISPSKLIARRDTASQQPHRAPRHKPTAANAQAKQTAPIRITAHTPMPPSPARARGLSRH